jgi:putative ABC transport system ATP-binding protein
MTLIVRAPDLLLSQLTVTFTDRGKSFRAVAVESLALAGGSSLAITGPSGCGKSTLLYTLAGLLRPTGGRATWDDLNLFALSERACDAWRRRNIGFLFQDFELLPELTPAQNVLLPATFESFRIADATLARAHGLLDRFSVPARGRTGSLSRGERQRVALARALIFDPPIILADEPTASLDAASGETVIAVLVELATSDGRTVIATSHDQSLISHFDARLRLEHGWAAELVWTAP